MRDVNVSSSLDDYYDFITKHPLGIAIVVNGDELPFLKNEGNHWIFSFGIPLFVLRASLEDFETLEIGIHPKVIVYSRGSEVANFDGIPNYRKIKAVLK